MAQSGRPLKYDPRVDDIMALIDSGEFNVAKDLLQEIGIDITDGYGRTFLINGVLKGHLQFVAWLIEHKAEINHKDKAGYTALHFAAQEGNVEAALFLIEKGANTNIQDIHGNTPLWTAIFNGKLTNPEQVIVEALLKNGADPDIENNYGKTPRSIYEKFHNKNIPTV